MDEMTDAPLWSCPRADSCKAQTIRNPFHSRHQLLRSFLNNSIMQIAINIFHILSSYFSTFQFCRRRRKITFSESPRGICKKSNNCQISMHQLGKRWTQPIRSESRWVSLCSFRTKFIFENLFCGALNLPMRSWLDCAVVEEQSSSVFLPHQHSGSESRWGLLRNLFPQEMCLDNSPTDGLLPSAV